MARGRPPRSVPCLLLSGFSVSFAVADCPSCLPYWLPVVYSPDCRVFLACQYHRTLYACDCSRMMQQILVEFTVDGHGGGTTHKHCQSVFIIVVVIVHWHCSSFYSYSYMKSSYTVGNKTIHMFGSFGLCIQYMFWFDSWNSRNVLTYANTSQLYDQHRI